MHKTIATLNDCRFEILAAGDQFHGLGRIWIGDTLVRSGRLPLSVYTQSFKGHELASLTLLGVDQGAGEIRLRLAASFRPLPVKLLRDHSFDPIHETRDWQAPVEAGTGRLALLLRPATDAFNGVDFAGFAYHYEYVSDSVPLFYLYDRASWELDGDIVGATAVSQSSCSDPVATFAADTGWSTEGLMHWDPEAANPVMTHNLPRWASHGSFDFQHKGDATLIGVWEQVSLIRSVLRREPGKPELKVFDKYIFDDALAFSTPAKSILLNRDPKSEIAQRNLWTWVCDEVHERARAEFGLAEEPLVPRLSYNYWRNFTVDTYRQDLLPAAAAIGARQIFVDNLRKSAMTDQTPFPGKFNWNMCCGHEYEIAPELGGNDKVKAFVDECAAAGIQVMSWTNNDQALSSPLNQAERDDGKGWFVLLEDTRQKYGGAYAGCMSILDFACDEARRYFVDSHIKVKAESKLAGYLFDSFYNLGFMPISYRDGRPRTMWRQLLTTFKELQDAGIHFLIESFGPFGQPQHGCPRSYSLDRCWVVYKIGLGNDYTTVPGGPTYDDPRAADAAALYYTLAHMTCPPLHLFKDGQRIDQRWTAEHRRILAEYNDNRTQMHRRHLQEDDQAVLWHNRAGDRATLWNFANREGSLPGQVVDLTTSQPLPPARRYHLLASHTYAIAATPLPTAIGGPRT